MPMRVLHRQPCLLRSRLTAQFLVVIVVVCAALPAFAVGLYADASDSAFLPVTVNSMTTIPSTIAIDDAKARLLVLDSGHDRSTRKMVLLQ